MKLLPDIAAFDKAHHPTAKLLVGGQGIPIAEFLQAPRSTGFPRNRDCDH